jgi:hypothetical protein
MCLGSFRQEELFLKEKFWRLATKKHRKPPATMAIAHTLLVLSFQVLRTGQPYRERGLPALDEKQKNRLIWHHVRRLGKLGIRVYSPPVLKNRKLPKSKKMIGKGN